VWVSASEGTQRVGRIRINIYHAKAGFFRESGRIIQQLTQFCECGFGISIKKRIRTEQRARRWRAACPLTDGVVDSGETDPIKKDSDGDSLDDGDEINEYGCDPTVMDTDEDGLTDGQEVDGWTVAICHQVSKKAIGDPWHVTSNASDTDSDDDGLTDYQEFMNGSDPKKIDTDGDTITDSDELLDDDDENTPTAFDGIAPSIKIDIDTTEKWWKRYIMEIQIYTKDLAGVDWVKIDIKGDGKKAKKINLYGEKEKLIEISHEIDWCRGLGDGYKIVVEDADINGNEGKAEKKVPGLLKKIVDAILDVIMAIAEACARLASMFIDFIWGAIEGMMDAVFKPIIDGINNWVRGVGSALGVGFSEFKNTNSISDSSVDKIGKALFGPFWEILKIIGQIVTAIMNVIKPFLELVSNLIEDVANFIGDVIKSAFGISGGRDEETENNLLTFITGGLESLVDGICSLLGFSSESESKSATSDMVSWLGFIKALVIIIFGVYLCVFNVADAFLKLITGALLTIAGCLLYLGRNTAKNTEEKGCLAVLAFLLTGIGFSNAIWTLLTGDGLIIRIIGGILGGLGILQFILIGHYLDELYYKLKKEEEEQIIYSSG